MDGLLSLGKRAASATGQKLTESRTVRSTVGQETLSASDAAEEWETPNLKKSMKKLEEVRKVIQKIQGGSRSTPAHWSYNPKQRELTVECGSPATATVVAATIDEGIPMLAEALDKVLSGKSRKIDSDLEAFVGMKAVRFQARSTTKLIITLQEHE